MQEVHVPSHFTLRMQFGLHQKPDEITRMLLNLVHKAPVDEIMIFYFAEELNDGHDPLDRIRRWIANTRPCHEALVREEIAVSRTPGTPCCTAIGDG